MKKSLCLVLLLSITGSLSSQEVLSLDSCRALALANNKELRIGNEKIKAAYYDRKAAFTNYLPNISAMGTYMRNEKNIALLGEDKFLPIGSLTSSGTFGYTPGTGQVQEIKLPTGQWVPTDASGVPFDPTKNPEKLVWKQYTTIPKDQFEFDTKNVYVGAITLTQPIYMGGKIRAYNKITQFAEELAKSQHKSGMQEVILNTDQAYWQVVSLVNKKNLAEGYLKLLKKLEGDVDKMIAEGVATKADGLSIKVKVNEAEMTLTKVEDGLSLSRMLLCQICGIDLTTPIKLTDETINNISVNPSTGVANIDMAFENRPELKSLKLATDIYNQKINVTRSEFLPSVALIGNYIVSNPSMFNGFENKFRGQWNVGVMVKVPIWHWGEGSYKVNAAKAEARVAQFQLADAKEKIQLQVNQSAFKVNEAAKKLVMAEKNMEKAEENLRYATLGFEEGVIPPSNVLEAHTAWLSAQSEKIDAQIDVKLTEIYLQKSLGTLTK
ncbi:TolC family protein [uncultured Bacteroides sp.]|uniref:TolC family protein n=1 Tax=uncultured Bacteroides sp. TaxID=162156 RepID=UPI002AA84EAF|nr:TolC family protein [uncultured Bacteroides sp.]